MSFFIYRNSGGYAEVKNIKRTYRFKAGELVAVEVEPDQEQDPFGSDRILQQAMSKA